MKTEKKKSDLGSWEVWVIVDQQYQSTLNLPELSGKPQQNNHSVQLAQKARKLLWNNNETDTVSDNALAQTNIS